MLSVFLAGSWRENRLQFFESYFLFTFVHFGKLGGQNSGMGSAELLQRFPGGFLRENAAFWSRICYNPTSFPFGYVRVLVIFRPLLAVPLKFGLFVILFLSTQG